MQNKIIITIGFLMLALTISAGAATREECASAVVISSGIDTNDVNDNILDSYTDGHDLPDGWRKKKICAAIQNNILLGYEDNTLRLNEEVTRAEFACMIYRAKDFYNTPPIKPVTYNGVYADISDWNKNAIYYCMENGFLMGYGDRFGADDTITSEQIDTVINRVKLGLSTKEKYLLYEVCGSSPIPVSQFLYSAYDDELTNTELPQIPTFETVDTSHQTPDIVAYRLRNLLDLQGNMDYERFKNERYKEYVLQNFEPDRRTYPSALVYIKEGDSVTTIENLIADAEARHIKRDSIFVFSPVNSVASAMFGGWSRKRGAGYEYYCYLSIDGDTPHGEKIGVWYKRKIVVDYCQYISASTKYGEMYCHYNAPEELSYREDVPLKKN